MLTDLCIPACFSKEIDIADLQYPFAVIDDFQGIESCHQDLQIARNFFQSDQFHSAVADFVLQPAQFFMDLEDVGAIAKPQRYRRIFVFGRGQPGDRDGHIGPEHQDAALCVKEFIHVLFIDVVKPSLVCLVKFHGRCDDFFIAPAVQSGFDIISQLCSDPAFFRDQIAHALRNRELFHRFSSF